MAEQLLAIEAGPRRYVLPAGGQPALPHDLVVGDRVVVRPLSRALRDLVGKRGRVVKVLDDGGIYVDVAGEIVGIGWTRVERVETETRGQS